MSPVLALFLALLPGLPQTADPPDPGGPEGVSAEVLEALARRYGDRWTPEARAYQIAGPSVVAVQSYRRRGAGLNRSASNAPLGTPISQGTGVVIDAAGFVITNAHVVAPNEAESVDQFECWLRFSDDFGGRRVRAEPLSLDREWDLALLKITDEGPFAALPLHESTDHLVGERVIAIGSPYGTSLAITTGILSGTGRDIRVQGVGSVHALTGLIQTDAAINPGNSGGPLLNALGQMIGICTATLKSAEGISYAIPSARVREIMEQRLFRPRVWHGIRMRPSSLVIERLHPRGPAARAGLLEGDLITACDGAPLADPIGWQRALVLRKAGDVVQVGYRRGGKGDGMVRFALADEDAYGSVGVLGFSAERYDMEISVPGLTYNQSVTLLRVREVFPGSGAEALGIVPDDTIVAVHLTNGANVDGWVPVSSQEQFVALVSGKEFDFDGLNLWWVKADGSSLKGRLTFDDPALPRGAS